MKRFFAFCLAAVLTLFGCTGCRPLPKDEKYTYQFFDTFDTLIQITGRAESQEEFDAYAKMAHESFRTYQDLFDKFEDHGRTDNIAAVNAAAGISPVKVEPRVMEIVLFSLEQGDACGGAADITAGPLISLWQKYISLYSGNAENAVLPSQEEISCALALCGRQMLEVNEADGTLFLRQKGASLDLGAVAKGWATEAVARELQQAGWENFALNSGGDIRVSGHPQKTERWKVGIQSPFSGAVLAPQSDLLGVVELESGSVVTSGDYQRYYMVGDRRLHHIIDPKTGMPADRYRSVTVLTEDSGLADFLSTALFVMDQKEGEKLAARSDAGVLWVYPDGTQVTCGRMESDFRSS